MSMPIFSVEPTEMVAVGFAFALACEELGIGDGSLDVANRERVAQLLLAFARKGENDVDVLCRRAVIQFRNTSAPAS